MLTFWPSGLSLEQLADSTSKKELIEALLDDGVTHYEAREVELGAEVLRQVERQVMLRIIDTRWREHLFEMDYLQEGINLRAMGQRDPLTEWQREGYEMFGQMMQGIAQDLVRYVMHVQVSVSEPAKAQVEAAAAKAAAEAEAARIAAELADAPKESVDWGDTDGDDEAADATDEATTDDATAGEDATDGDTTDEATSEGAEADEADATRPTLTRPRPTRPTPTRPRPRRTPADEVTADADRGRRADDGSAIDGRGHDGRRRRRCADRRGQRDARRGGRGRSRGRRGARGRR